jgi:hypothetical protein
MEVLALKIGQRGCEQAAVTLNIPSRGPHPGSLIVDLHHLSPCEMGWTCRALGLRNGDFKINWGLEDSDLAAVVI